MTDAPRHDGRTPDQLREVRITRNWLDHAEGSCLVSFGRTRVLTTATVMETSKGNFDIAIALSVILLLLIFFVNAVLTYTQQRQRPL